MPEIKFCGLTRAADAAQAIALGADYLGVVLAPSARQLSLEAARALFASTGSAPRRVGVFVDPSVDEVLAAIETLGLHAVQLHGSPAEGTIAAIRAAGSAQVWSVVPMTGAAAQVARPLPVAGRSDVLLFDTSVGGRTGGTGRAFDWAGARATLDRFRPNARIAIAGGLRADNVASAIRALSPDIVDVSSGVEASPGVKDHQRMNAFVEAVRGRQDP